LRTPRGTGSTLTPGGECTLWGQSLWGDSRRAYSPTSTKIVGSLAGRCTLEVTSGGPKVQIHWRKQVHNN
jgi:hypothetical protein